MTALAAALVAGPVAADVTTYRIDADRSQLLVRLSKAGLGSAMAHDHVVEATVFEGVVRWDPATPAGASVETTVDARGLVADDPGLRAELGMEGELADDKRAEVQSTMEGEGQLDVERYPAIAFRSSSVEAAEDGAVRVTGELELHGTIRTVSFTTTPEIDGDTLRARAEIRFLQSDYGIEPYSAFLGMVRNRDEARLVADLVAVAVSAQRAPGGEGPASDHSDPVQ